MLKFSKIFDQNMYVSMKTTYVCMYFHNPSLRSFDERIPSYQIHWKNRSIYYYFY